MYFEMKRISPLPYPKLKNIPNIPIVVMPRLYIPKASAPKTLDKYTLKKKPTITEITVPKKYTAD